MGGGDEICGCLERCGLLLALLPVCSAESLDFFRNGGISDIWIGWRVIFKAKVLALLREALNKMHNRRIGIQKHMRMNGLFGGK